MRTTAVAAAAAAAVVLLAAGCASGTDDGYDEAAHRAAAEAYHGTIVDWDVYRDTIAEMCESEDLELFAVGWMAEGDMGPLVLGVHYRCPDRMGELAPLLADYGV